MRLIDGDDLEKLLRYYMGVIDDYDMTDSHDIGFTAAMYRAIISTKESPTIDAVPVIRCLACAWRSPTGFCGRHGHPVADDFFCANGTKEIIKKPAPAKKAEKKAEEICGLTGKACTKCRSGACEHRRKTND